MYAEGRCTSVHNIMTLKFVTAIMILMTGAAEEILNKCTVSDPQWQNPAEEQYCVAFNYEFVEDSRDYVQDNDVG